MADNKNKKSTRIEIETDRPGLSKDQMCSMTPSEMRRIVGGLSIVARRPTSRSRSKVQINELSITVDGSSVIEFI